MRQEKRLGDVVSIFYSSSIGLTDSSVTLAGADAQGNNE